MQKIDSPRIRSELFASWKSALKSKHLRFAIFLKCEIQAVPAEIIMNTIILLLLLLLVIFTIYAPKATSCAPKAMSHYYSKNVF